MLNLKNIHISWALEVGGVRIDSLLQQEQLNCYMIVVAAGILGRAAVACRRRARGRGRARLGGPTRVPKESIQGQCRVRRVVVGPGSRGGGSSYGT